MAGMAWALEKRHALIRARWSRQRDRAREAHRALQCAAAAASHPKQCSRPACIYLQPRDAAPFPSAAAAAAAAPMLQHGAALCRCMSVPAFSMGVKILHIWGGDAAFFRLEQIILSRLMLRSSSHAIGRALTMCISPMGFIDQR